MSKQRRYIFNGILPFFVKVNCIKKKTILFLALYNMFMYTYKAVTLIAVKREVAVIPCRYLGITGFYAERRSGDQTTSHCTESSVYQK